MVQHLTLRTMEGLGDNLWSRPVIRALARQHDALTLMTPWPQCYIDLASAFNIAFTRPTHGLDGTGKPPLRTQRENVERWQHWAGRDGPPAFRLFYPPEKIRRGSNHHDELVACASRWLGEQSVEPREIAMAIPDDWQQRADELLTEWSQINGPVVLVRPPTVRSEWLNPARNCDPAALQVLIDLLRPDHTLVGFASLAPGQEWLEQPEPAGLHLRYYQGELAVETLFGLFRRAWVIGANGFMLPMSIAMGGYCFVLFGGNYGYNAPHNLLHPGYDLSRIGYSVPDQPCVGCTNPRHACSKRIDPDRLIAEFSDWRARQMTNETKMGALLSTRAFDARYYEEHKAAGLDYLGFGTWQQNYGAWLTDVFDWCGKRVLDLGCACGSILLGLLSAGVNGIGVDLSEDMVQRGRAQWPELSSRLYVCDAVHLHLFDDAAFDGLHCAQVAEHWKPELVPHILDECRRVLRPGSLVWCCLDTAELYRRQNRNIETEDPTHYCIRPIDWWRESFARAGFIDRTERYRPQLLAHPRSMLAGATSAGPAKYDWDFLVLEAAA